LSDSEVQAPPRAALASPFLAACRREKVERVPVWFMRQAGRSLPEYRDLRATGSILGAIADPELAAEITMQPVRRYGVDAAILFSDIVVPLQAIGFGVDVVQGKGPVVAEPFRSASDLERLRPLEADVDLPYVAQTVKILKGELNPLGTPLIGFAGAPFTLASYLIEGGPSHSFARTKSLMHAESNTWSQLMERLAQLSIAFLKAQIQAGANAVQLFDSWAGNLSPGDYERFVLPTTTMVFDALADLGIPRIVFGVGTGELLTLMASSGADVVGVDWRVPLDEARRRVGPDHALQGNLDPSLCLSPWDVVQAEARRVLDQAGTEPGYVFNLGHGVLPETDPGILAELVQLVHREGRAGVGA
jgi:uroporphyrinogen decarboxylase